MNPAPPVSTPKPLPVARLQGRITPPHLTSAWVYYQNPVARIQARREPVLRWGARPAIHLVPIKNRVPPEIARLAQKTFAIPSWSSQPLTQKIAPNPWTCRPATPPCAASKTPHRTWWRCVYHHPMQHVLKSGGLHERH